MANCIFERGPVRVEQICNRRDESTEPWFEPVLPPDTLARTHACHTDRSKEELVNKVTEAMYAGYTRRLTLENTCFVE